MTRSNNQRIIGGGGEDHPCGVDAEGLGGAELAADAAADRDHVEVPAERWARWVRLLAAAKQGRLVGPFREVRLVVWVAA